MLDLGRFVVAASFALSLLGVVAVPIFPWGNAHDAYLGAVTLALLLLFAPMLLPPVAYWCDWTVSSTGDWLYVETFLRGRKTVQRSKLSRISTRLVVGRGGSMYCAALWEEGNRLPRVILTWDAFDGGQTKQLLRELASSPTVTVSPRAHVALELPDAPAWTERLILSSRTLGSVIVYVGVAYVVAWGYLALIG